MLQMISKSKTGTDRMPKCRGPFISSLCFVPSSNKRYCARFLVLAHEIAHNLTDLHNSDHEFWLSAICEAHLVAFSRLLRPANTRHRGVMWFVLVAIVMSVAYLAKRMTSTPR